MLVPTESTGNKQIKFKKNLFYFVIDERAGSGSVNQVYGSKDPDPYQYVTDPEHWYFYAARVCWASIHKKLAH